MSFTQVPINAVFLSTGLSLGLSGVGLPRILPDGPDSVTGYVDFRNVGMLPEASRLFCLHVTLSRF